MMTLKQKRLAKIKAAENFSHLMYEMRIISFNMAVDMLVYFENKVYAKTKV